MYIFNINFIYKIFLKIKKKIKTINILCYNIIYLLPIIVKRFTRKVKNIYFLWFLWIITTELVIKKENPINEIDVLRYKKILS